MTQSNSAARAAGVAEPPANKAVLLAVAGLLVTMTNAVIFALPPLLPVMEDQFGLTTVAAQLWIYTALTLGGGAGFILLPRLADVRGDRKAAIIGASFLTAGALIPAIGNSYATALIGSVLLGFGAAAQLLPLGFMRRNLGEGAIALAVAVLLIATGTGVVIGMIGGGLAIEYASLRAFFVALTVLAAVTVWACSAGIPEHDDEATGSVGAVSAVWLIGCVATILLGLTQGLVWAGGLGGLILLLVGGGLAYAWFKKERNATDAIFDVAFFKAPLVTASCVCILMVASANAAFLLLATGYVQMDPADLPAADAYGLGLTALKTGVLMLPFALTFVVGSIIVDGAVNNGKTVSVFVQSAAILAGGLIWFSAAHDQQWHYLVGAAIMGLACSMGYSAGFTAVQLAAPEEKAGMAAGIAGTFMAIGFAFGTALVSGVLSAEVIPKEGTVVEVATEPLYAQGYQISLLLPILVIVTLAVSRRRSRRRELAAA